MDVKNVEAIIVLSVAVTASNNQTAEVVRIDRGVWNKKVIMKEVWEKYPNFADTVRITMNIETKER